MADPKGIADAMARLFEGAHDDVEPAQHADLSPAPTPCPHCGKDTSQGNTLGAKIGYPGAEKFAK